MGLGAFQDVLRLGAEARGLECGAVGGLVVGPRARPELAKLGVALRRARPFLASFPFFGARPLLGRRDDGEIVERRRRVLSLPFPLGTLLRVPKGFRSLRIFA
jgi:hypothetical protein